MTSQLSITIQNILNTSSSSQTTMTGKEEGELSSVSSDDNCELSDDPATEEAHKLLEVAMDASNKYKMKAVEGISTQRQQLVSNDITASSSCTSYYASENRRYNHRNYERDERSAAKYRHYVARSSPDRSHPYRVSPPRKSTFWTKYQSSLSSWTKKFRERQERNQMEKHPISRTAMKPQSRNNECNENDIYHNIENVGVKNPSESNRSHLAEVGQNYLSLLEKYKDIQKEIENIKKAEEKEKLRIGAAANAPSPIKANEVESTSEVESKKQAQDDEDELELRRIALESAFNNAQVIPDEDSTRLHTSLNEKNTTSPTNSGQPDDENIEHRSSAKSAASANKVIASKSKTTTTKLLSLQTKTLSVKKSKLSHKLKSKHRDDKPTRPLVVNRKIFNEKPTHHLVVNAIACNQPPKRVRRRRNRTKHLQKKKLLQKSESERIIQPGDINRVLQIDNQEQRIEEFLKLVKTDKNAQVSKMHDVLTLETQEERVNQFLEQVSSGNTTKMNVKSTTQPTADNYVVEEMEIDSDSEQAEIQVPFSEPMTTYNFAYTPTIVAKSEQLAQMAYDPRNIYSVDLGYDPTQYNGQQPSHYQYITPGEIVLPCDLQVPPPPPPRNSPPPLPDEPPPEDDKPIPPPESLPAVPNADEKPPADVLDDDVDLLRAELLQAVANKRRRLIKEDDCPSRDGSPMSLGVTQSPPAKLNRPATKPVHQRKVTMVKSMPMYPKQEPIIIQIRASDSDTDYDEPSASDDCSSNPSPLKPATVGRPSSLSFSMNLNQFLREQRNTVEKKVGNDNVGDDNNTATLITKDNIVSTKKSLIVKTGSLSSKTLNSEEKPVDIAVLELKSSKICKKITKQQKTPKTAKTAITLAEFRQMEEKVQRERALLALDSSKLQKTQIQLMRRKTILQTADERVKKLHEQLAAAEKIATANKTQVEKMAIVVGDLQRRTQSRKTKVASLDSQLMIIGNEVHGTNYVCLKDKIKKKAVKVTKSIDKTDQLSKTTKQKKEQLLMMEKQLFEQINLYKSQQEMKKSSNSPSPVRMTKLQDAPTHRKSVHIAAEIAQPMVVDNVDKIDLPVLNENETEVSDLELSSRRRHSLMDMNTSMKPEFAEDHVENKTGDCDDVITDKIVKKKEKLKDGIFQVSAITSDMMLKVVKLQSTASKFCSIMRRSDEIVQRITNESNQKLEGVKVAERNTSQNLPGSYQPYQSFLSCFKGCRLGRFYRTKGKLPLSSPAFANKIEAKKLVCRFDLMGKCNDDCCPWQHRQDYTMTQCEILQDILAYCPSEAGVSKTTAKDELPTIIGNFAEDFLKQNKGRMKFEELCILLVSRVNKALGSKHPHYIPDIKRPWYILPLKKSVPKGHKEDEIASEEVREKEITVAAAKKFDWMKKLNADELEDVICDEDCRYYQCSGIQDMEQAVLEDPRNVSLWIKLAYRKLYDTYSEPGAALDHALNVLARALEAFCNSKDLWIHYLLLYQKRCDSNDEICEMFETAVKYACDYSLWWRYLECIVGFTGKEQMCHRILSWLSSRSESMKTAAESFELSHQTLEIIFYLVNLKSITGRFRTAAQVLQHVRKGRNVGGIVISKLLTSRDRLKVLLGYMHLLEYKFIPDEWFLTKPGKLVLKKLPVFKWDTNARSKPDVLVQLLKDGIKEFSSIESDDRDEIILCLNQNLINLEVILERFDSAKAICQEQLLKHYFCEEMWVHYSSICKTKNPDASFEVLKDKFRLNPHSPLLAYHTAHQYYSIGDSLGASELLCSFVNSLFDTPTDDAWSNPHYQYRLLLNQSVQVSPNPPKLRDDVGVENLQNHKVYLWLNYCLLLELRKDSKHATDMYETAMCNLHKTEDVQMIWWSLLQHKMRCLMAVTVSDVKTKQKDFRSLLDIVQRCLVSMPSRFAVPYRPHEYYLDYTFHNQVVLSIINLVSDDEEQEKLFDHYLSAMASNTYLLKRAVSNASAEKNLPRVRILCMSAVHNQVTVVSLWKSAIALYLQEENIREFILFELVRGSSGDAQILINESTKLGLNVQDFLHAITSS